MELTPVAAKILADNPVIKSSVNQLVSSDAKSMDIFIGGERILTIFNPSHSKSKKAKRDIRKAGLL